MGGDRAQMQFFFQICNEVLGVKKGGLSPPPRATGGPVALPSGDRWAQPTGAAGGPVAPPPPPRGRPG